MSSTSPLCSIVIPVYNQVAYTRMCIEGLIETLGTTDKFEILIIDNASSDETPSYLKLQSSKYPLIRYYRMNENLGFNRASNFGAEKANGEYLVFLNNDTIPQAGWIEALINAISQPKVGLVGCKLVYPESFAINHAGYVYSSYLGSFYSIYNRFPESFHGVNKEREYQALLGACIMIKSKLFSDIGGFALYALEDIDICLKVREKGLAVLYTPKGRVLHYGSVTLLANNSTIASPSNLKDINLRWPKESLICDDWQFYLQDGLLEAHHQGNFANHITKSQALFQQSRILYETGEREQSLNLLKESVQLFDRNIEASLELVCQLTEVEKLNEAVTQAFRIILLEPRCYQAYFNAHQILNGLGDQLKAKEIINELLKLENLPLSIQHKAESLNS